METKASYVLIGSFALAIIVLAVVSILWLGNLSLDREWDFYDVIFEEAVTGLGTGGAVQYNGIQVGEVRRLSLDAEDPRRVIARIRVRAETPIKVDTRATLTFTGITGVSIIQLSGGTPEAARLRPEPDRDAAVIVADVSALQTLLASGEGIVTSVNELMLRLSVLLKDDNLSALSSTFAHLEEISGSVAERSDDIGQALADIAAASKDFKSTVRHANQLMASLDKSAHQAQVLIERDGPALLEQTRLGLLAAQQAGERLSLLVEENRAAISAFSNQGLADVGPVLNDLRATLRPLRDLASRLQAEPGLLLQGVSQPLEQSPP